MAKRVAILTLVGNTRGGSGPGHTALVVDGTAYSFENAGDWFSAPSRERSGWISLPTTDYLDRNDWRPVIVQEMNPAHVRATSVLRYIRRSMAADDDYLGSGVCSSQVSNAIDAATVRPFNPRRVDTPHKVFTLARNRGLVSSTYLIWGQPQENDAARRLASEYATVNQSGAGILSWI